MTLYELKYYNVMATKLLIVCHDYDCSWQLINGCKLTNASHLHNYNNIGFHSKLKILYVHALACTLSYSLSLTCHIPLLPLHGHTKYPQNGGTQVKYDI